MKRFTCFLLTVAALATAPAFAQEAVAAPTAQPTPAAKIIDAAQKPASATSKPAAKAPKASVTPTKTPASSPAPSSSKPTSATKPGASSNAATSKPTATKSAFSVARVNPGKGEKTHAMRVETLGRTSTVQVGEPVLTRAQLRGATSGQESLKVTSGAKPESRNVAVIRLRFTKEGTKALHDLSTAAQGSLLAVLVDGQIIAMPKITEPISSGEWTISGNFTPENVKALVDKINAAK